MLLTPKGQARFCIDTFADFAKHSTICILLEYNRCTSVTHVDKEIYDTHHIYMSLCALDTTRKHPCVDTHGHPYKPICV